MDFKDERIRENLNEDYSTKKFEYTRNYKFLKYLLIPVCAILIFLFGINIFMEINNFDEIIKYSEMFEVDPAMTASIIHVESKFRPNAVSNKEAYGLMQITSDTFDFVSDNYDVGDVTFDNITDSELNIMVGTWYYSYLLKEFNNNKQNALCAYNAGPGTVRSWLSNPDYCFNGEDLYIIPYDETAQYIHRINTVYPIYKTMISLKF